MDKRKKNTYLSELFLENLNGDFSRRAVLRALEKCNDEVLKRMRTYLGVRELVCCFYYKGKQTKKPSEQITQELVDFWDVYGEFDHMLKPGVKRKYLILQML